MTRDTSTLSEVVNQVSALFSRLGIRTKLILAFSLVLCSVLLPLWLILQNQLAIAARLQSEEIGSMLASEIADKVTFQIITGNSLNVLAVLEELVNSPGVLHVAAYDVDNQVIAEVGSNRAPSSNNIYRFTTPLETDDSISGVLELTLQFRSVSEQSRNLQILFLGILVAGLIFTTVTSMAMSEHILMPARRLLAACQNPLEAEPLTESMRQDEIREAEEAGMDLLFSYQDYLQEETWRQENLEAWRKRNADVSLVLIEVAKFETTLSLLNPSAMIRLLDSYYRFIEAISERYDGTIFQFTGDLLILAFDRQRFTHPEHAAVCCSKLFQSLVEEYNQEQLAQAAPVLEFKTLIHSGPVQITRTGELDSSRMALIGETIESARHLLTICPPAEISISTDSRRELATSFQLDYKTVVQPDADSPDQDRENTAIMLIDTPMEHIDEELPELATDLINELFGQEE